MNSNIIIENKRSDFKMMQARGTVVVVLPLFIKEKYGPEAFKKWLDSLSSEAKNLFSTNIVISSWYPMGTMLVEPTKKMAKLLYNGNIKMAAYELGKFSADFALRGVYKFFVKIGTPEYTIKRARSILPTYYSPCELDVVDLKENSTILRITKFEEISEVIEEITRGWIDGCLEIIQVKNGRAKITKSLTKKDPYTEYVVTWE